MRLVRKAKTQKGPALLPGDAPEGYLSCKGSPLKVVISTTTRLLSSQHQSHEVPEPIQHLTVKISKESVWQEEIEVC